MVELSREELLKELAEEAEKIHDSTRVDMPLFSPVHNYLRSKSPTYYKWAISGKSNTLHVTGALGFVVSVFIFMFVQFVWPNLFIPKPETALAGSSTVTWTTQADFQSATTNSGIDVTSVSGSVLQALPAYSPQGDGADGPLTRTSSFFNINSQTNGYNGRTAADGVTWDINSNISSGQSTISSSVSRPAGFAVGDEIMIINLKGTTTDYANVGLYELKTIANLPSSTSITVDSNLINSYNGTTQKIVVQRVPNYTNVTISGTNTSITSNNWDGVRGGVLAFRANGTISVGSGSIILPGRGYRGGSGNVYTSNSQSGEWPGGGLVSSGGTNVTNGISNNPGGGGGGAGSNASFSGTGGGGTLGSGGGGAGGCSAGAGYSCVFSSGGGSGGHGTVGSGGQGSGSDGASGGGANGGNGGNSTGVSYPTIGGGGGGGMFGSSTTLYQKMNLGSGGGAGGGYYQPSFTSGSGLPGGSGGGILWIGANSFTNSGSIYSNGENVGTSPPGHSGAGAGGSIVIQSRSYNNIGSINTIGGTASVPGVGGVGRSYISYTSKAGSNPSNTVLVEQSYGYSSPATLGGTSAGNVGLRADTGTTYKAKAKSLTWSGTTASSGQKLLFTLRVGDSQAELDSSLCYGPTGSGACSTWWSNSGGYFSQINGQANSGTDVTTTIPVKRYIEVLVRMESGGTNTAQLDNITIEFGNLEAPLNDSTTLKHANDTSLNNSLGASGAGLPGLWSNEGTVKITSTDLTCTNCGASDGRKIEVQYNPVNTAFTDETTNLFEGDSPDNSISTAIITGLSPGNYHLRMRSRDNQGRVSAWTSYGANTDITATDFSIDQASPTGNVTIEDGDSYTNSQTVTLDTSSASDTGGAGLYQMRFSNDGTNWGDWTNYTSSASWDLSAGDGAKTVYAQYKDNAGNISSQLQDTTQANFNAGLTKTNVVVSSSGYVELGGTAVTDYVIQPDPTAGIDGYEIDGAWNADDQSLYVDDYSSTYIKFAGLDDLPNDAVVTSAKLYFTCYASCTNSVALGKITQYWDEGNWGPPTSTDILSGLTGNSFVSGVTVTSTVQDQIANNNFGFVIGDITWAGTTSFYSSDFGTVSSRPKLVISYSAPSGPPYNATGTFESRAIDSGSASVNYGDLNYSQYIPSGASLSMEVRAATTEGGLASATYSSVSNGGSLSAFNNKQWIQYRASFANGGNNQITPILDDVFIEKLNAISDTITLDMNPPASFTLSSPGDNSWQDNATPTFSWNASSDGNGLSKYQLYIDNELNRDNIASDLTSTTPLEALSGGSHAWYIRAIDSAGNGTNSDTRTVKIDLANPSSSTLNGTAISETQINLSWTASVDDGEIDRYLIERSCLSCDPVVDFEQIAITEGAATTYQDTTGLSAGSTYRYRIKAVDKAEKESSYSNEKELATIDTISPQQPAGLQVFETMFGDRLNLSFLGGKDGVRIDKYFVYSSLTELGEYTKVAELDIDPNVRDDSSTERNITVENLVDNKEYWFMVSALDEAGNESAKTSVVSGQTPDTTNPVFPVDFSIQVTATSSSAIDLAWTGATDFSSDGQTFGSAQDANGFNGWYRVERSENEIDWSDASSSCLNIQTESCSDTGLTALTTYYYRVRAVDKAGSESDPIHLGNRVSSPAIDSNNSAETYTDAVPTAPINLSVAYSSGTSNQVTFTGATSSLVGGTQGYPLDYYRVYRFTGSEQTGSGATTNEQLADWISKNNATKVGGDIDVTSQSSGSRSASNYEYVDDNAYNVTDSGLTNATTYKYKVVAFDTTPSSNVPSGPFASPMSSTYAVTTPDTIVPDVYSSDSFEIQTDVIYGPSAFGSRIVVSWTHAPEATRQTTATVSSDNTSTIILSSGGGSQFVNGQFIKIDSEILKITNIASDTLTVSRSQANSQEASHAGGSVVSVLDFTKYRVFKDSGSGFIEIDSQEFNSPELNYFVDADIEDGISYKYKVTVVDSASTFKGYVANQPNQIVQAQNNESQGKETVSLDPSNIDTVAPTIIGNTVGVNPGVSSATISWNTDEASTTTVYYGETEGSYTKKAGDITSQSGQEVLKSSGHSTVIRGLESNGKSYYYKVESRDASGNTVSKTGSFQTLSFTVTEVSAEVTSSSAVISWKTNIDSSSYVEYRRAQGSDLYKTEGFALMGKDHEVTVKNLSPGFYTYNVKSYDIDNNLAYISLQQFEIPTSDSGAFGTPLAAKVEEKEITATSAKVTWTSTVQTTSWVDYGIVSGSYTTSSGNDDLTLNHIVTIENLVPDTTYYYRIRGIDASGIEYTSREYTFKALAQPIISNITVSEVGSYEAVITFSTNINVQAGVDYGKDLGYGKRSQSQDFVKAHQVTLTELEDNQIYHFKVEAKDEAGNSVVSEDQVLKTPLDKTAPVISEVKLSPLTGSDDSKRGVIITWVTDKPSTSQVAYSSGVIAGSYNQKTAEDGTLTKAHTVVINNLDAGTTYHFQLLSKDKRDNLGRSVDYTMITQEAQESILELILKTLEDTFSWVGKIGEFFGDAFSQLFSF